MPTKRNRFFKKSSLSGRPGNKCVEVAITKKEIIVRNSKAKNYELYFTHEEWEAFVLGVINGEFNVQQ